MPTYTFECSICNSREDLLRSVEDRNTSWLCQACKVQMHRVPERFKAETFTPHFDEGLGSDVYSKADKHRVMKHLGVIESGDRVGGAINLDKHAPHTVGRGPLQGIRHESHPELDEKVVEVVDEKGKTVDKTKVGDLPSGLDSVNWSEKK